MIKKKLAMLMMLKMNEHTQSKCHPLINRGEKRKREVR